MPSSTGHSRGSEQPLGQPVWLERPVLHFTGACHGGFGERKRSPKLSARFRGRRFVDHAESVVEKPIPAVVAISKPLAGRSVRPARVVSGADSC